MPRSSGNVAVQCPDSAAPTGATVFPGIRTQGTPRAPSGDNYGGQPSQTCSGCRRSIPGSEFRSVETSFFDDGHSTASVVGAERGYVQQRTTRQPARSGNRRGPPNVHLAYTASSHNRSADNYDLCTRPSWVDAYTAYKQIKKVNNTYFLLQIRRNMTEHTEQAILSLHVHTSPSVSRTVVTSCSRY